MTFYACPLTKQDVDHDTVMLQGFDQIDSVDVNVPNSVLVESFLTFALKSKDSVSLWTE